LGGDGALPPFSAEKTISPPLSLLVFGRRKFSNNLTFFFLCLFQYWDSITKEDLEFSVGTKANTWEVKELLADDDRRHTLYQDAPSDYASSMYHHSAQRNSNYGGFGY
jgi:hypothetical protein